MKKLILFLAAIMMASTGLWAENVSYIDADGQEKTEDATEVTNSSSQVTWNAGWYVVKGEDVQLTAGAICNGAVHLILADGAKLTATGAPGIKVSGVGNALTIYGQATQTGQLIANGGFSGAGIGGGNGEDGSNITINGGIVTANGGTFGAGIGGGRNGSGSNITVNNGVVTANGGSESTGIGGGDRGHGENITINGGFVTANGRAGAGIGGGQLDYGSCITINGGIVTANSNTGAGIGGGYKVSGSNITINGGYVMTNSKDGDAIGSGKEGSSSNDLYVAADLIIKVGDKEYQTRVIPHTNGDNLYWAFPGKHYAIIGEIPASETTEVTYIDAAGEEQTADAIAVTSSNVPVLWGTGSTTTWYVVTGTDVQLSLGATCRGDVRLILSDDAKLTATGIDAHMSPGIRVSGKFNSLTIYGQANQSGQLIANGGAKGAGIGGGQNETGDNITINGGIVTATSGGTAAGIGGGDGTPDFPGHGTNITINGGVVTAIGKDSSAGIGGGSMGSGSNITINGGTVTAIGGGKYDAIGSGSYGSSSNIKVARTLLTKADGNNPPTTEIDNDGGDLADKLKNCGYAKIVSLRPFKDAAIAAIDVAIKGVTNEKIIAIATTAKTDIEAATSEKGINAIKERAMDDIESAIAFHNEGQTEAFGTLGTKQDGPALIVTDKDGNEIILYSPKSVEYIKVKEEE